MTCSYIFNLVKNFSDPYQGNITTLEVRTSGSRISFSKMHEYTLLESVAQTPFHQRMKITQKDGLAECQADPKCNQFVKSLLKEGFKLDEFNE